MAIVMKSENIISAMGLIPVIALPAATPIMASSEMGVFLILSLPNSSSIPTVTPKAPPYSAMSSPIRYILLSDLIFCCIASLIASRYVNSLVLSLFLGIYIILHFGRVGKGTFFCKLRCFLYFFYHLFFQIPVVFFSQYFPIDQDISV